MQFYALSGSPFSWKVWLALEHLGSDYDLRMLSVDAGDLKSNALLSRNPHGKVPRSKMTGLSSMNHLPSSSIWPRSPMALKSGFWPTDHRQRALRARSVPKQIATYIHTSGELWSNCSPENCHPIKML